MAWMELLFLLQVLVLFSKRCSGGWRKPQEWYGMWCGGCTGMGAWLHFLHKLLLCSYKSLSKTGVTSNSFPFLLQSPVLHTTLFQRVPLPLAEALGGKVEAKEGISKDPIHKFLFGSKFGCKPTYLRNVLLFRKCKTSYTYLHGSSLS